jgi:hypothetical protein
MGLVLNSVAQIENCVVFTTSKTKYLTNSLIPPKVVPVKVTLSPAVIPAVLAQVMRLVAADVDVQTGVFSSGGVDARKVS